MIPLRVLVPRSWLDGGRGGGEDYYSFRIYRDRQRCNSAGSHKLFPRRVQDFYSSRPNGIVSHGPDLQATLAKAGDWDASLHTAFCNAAHNAIRATSGKCSCKSCHPGAFIRAITVYRIRSRNYARDFNRFSTRRQRLRRSRKKSFHFGD